MSKKSVQDLINQAANAWDLKDMAECERLLIEATKVSKRSITAWSHLARFYSDKKNFIKAIEAYEKLFKLKPQTEMLTSYGSNLSQIGRMDEALKILERAVLQDPSQPNNTWYVYCNCFCYANLPQDWPKISNLKHNIDLAPWSQAFEILRHVLSHYILGNKEKFEEKLKDLLNLKDQVIRSNIQGMNQKEVTIVKKNAKHVYVYMEYLKCLAESAGWPTSETKELPTLHFLGDSHTLACNNKVFNLDQTEYRAQTHLIVGCKAWHYRDNADSFIQQSFKKHLSAIPANEPIVMMCGEIDCRHDEGMLLAAAKTGKTLEEIVTQTAANYIQWVKKNITQNPVIIAGVAAPQQAAVNVVHPKYQEVFIQMVATFNHMLKQEAHKAGFGFIDAHSYSSQPNGITREGLYIDVRHMLGQSWVEAIENHYTRPIET